MFNLIPSRDFLIGKAKPWLENFICDIVPSALTVPLLLSGIYLKLSELVATQQSAGLLDIIPVTTITGTPVVLLDLDSNGRDREVTVWIESAVGGPTPTIRISKDASGSGGGGIRVSPGQVNELGKIPGNVKLYVSSTSDISMYVMVKS